MATTGLEVVADRIADVVADATNALDVLDYAFY